MSKLLSDLRHDNKRFDLSQEQALENPIEQMQRWIDRAIEENFYQPNAMSLSTVNTSGQPTSRIVLLKDLSEKGLMFYTNFDSRKGKELTTNPKACALFYWDSLERQIRVEGTVVKLDDKTADSYFNSRPRESQMGAIASPQSQEIPDRQWLDKRFQEVRARYDMEGRICRPSFWGGFILQPEMIEFWQGRPSRLHDRLCYCRQPHGGWRISRLAP